MNGSAWSCRDLTQLMESKCCLLAANGKRLSGGQL